MKKVNDFFKKTNKENKFKMTKSKNVVCDVFDITIGEECSTIVVTLSKVTADMTILILSTGKVINKNIYDLVHEIKTEKYSTIEEAMLMNRIYKNLIKRYRYMFDGKSIDKIHLTYDRTF